VEEMCIQSVVYPEALFDAYPTATYLLPHRPLLEWTRSIVTWRTNNLKHWQLCTFQTRPRITDFGVFLEEHTASVHALKATGMNVIEFDVADPTPLFGVFPGIKRTCWGNQYDNPASEGSNGGAMRLADIWTR
jgi:hypothetical protein